MSHWYPSDVRGKKETLKAAQERIRQGRTDFPNDETPREIEEKYPVKEPGNFSGRRIGKLTVLGLHQRTPNPDNNVHTVQCECGTREVRREWWIRKTNLPTACCRHCRNPK